MICVSLREPRVEALLAALEGLEMAEIRLDLARVPIDRVGEVFSRPLPLVATFRPGGVGEDERLATLELAVRSGAAYVDLELETPAAARAPVVRAARETGCRVLLSHHDPGETPPRETLLRIAASCYSEGADIAKIACRVRSAAEAARILALYDRAEPIVALGLGPLGTFTRVAATALGAPFTYAALRPGEETADGQCDVETLRRSMRTLGLR